MDKDKLRRIIELATESLTPIALDVECLSEESLRVSIVSDQFAGMPVLKRISHIQELLEANAPDLMEAYLMVFEAFSIAESNDLGLAGIKSMGSSFGSSGKAAAEASD
jgi:hypothetical protein